MREKIPEAEREKILKLGCIELFSPGGKVALDYLKNVRQFDEEVIRKFSLGYMPKHIKNHLGDRHELAGRIVFPVYNQYDGLVAFSSRMPNVPRSFWHESYSKGLYLYGLNLAKKSILKNKKAIVVEGEFDVMKLHQFGIDCAVGVVGSAPQLHQIALLRRYCKDIFLVFDSDEAGQNAVNRITKGRTNNMAKYFNPIFLETNLIVVKLPEDMDPDDFLKTRSRGEFISLLKDAKKTFQEEHNLC